jgi:hypothetical protein
VMKKYDKYTTMQVPAIQSGMERVAKYLNSKESPGDVTEKHSGAACIKI